MSAPVTGLAVTVHNEQVPTPATPFPHESWVRMDGRSISAAHLASDAADCAYWKAAGYKVMYIVPSNIIGAEGQIGHIRDVHAVVAPDIIEFGNEPDINGVSHSTYSTAALAVRTSAFLFSKVQPFFVGPAACNMRTDNLAGPNSGLNYLTLVISDGGLAAFDGVTMHAYMNVAVDQPEIITTQIATVQGLIGSKPLVLSEFGINPADAGTVLSLGGNANATQQASIYSRAAVASGSVPFCFYDGPKTTGYGLCNWINGAGTNAPTALGTALNSALATDGFVGVGG